jgi:hypothetical protein
MSNTNFTSPLFPKSNFDDLPYVHKFMQSVPLLLKNLCKSVQLINVFYKSINSP